MKCLFYLFIFLGSIHHSRVLGFHSLEWSTGEDLSRSILKAMSLQYSNYLLSFRQKNLRIRSSGSSQISGKVFIFFMSLRSWMENLLGSVVFFFFSFDFWKIRGDCGKGIKNAVTFSWFRDFVFSFFEYRTKGFFYVCFHDLLPSNFFV